MKIKTRDYRFVLKLILAEHTFSVKYCKILAGVLALRTIRPHRVSSKHRKRSNLITAIDLIQYGFNWHESPEGYNFWYRIHCKLNKGINIHGEYIGTTDKEINEALLIPF